jgi:hypothetical protein
MLAFAYDNGLLTQFSFMQDMYVQTPRYRSLASLNFFKKKLNGFEPHFFGKELSYFIKTETDNLLSNFT